MITGSIRTQCVQDEQPPRTSSPIHGKMELLLTEIEGLAVAVGQLQDRVRYVSAHCNSVEPDPRHEPGETHDPEHCDAELCLVEAITRVEQLTERINGMRNQLRT